METKRKKKLSKKELKRQQKYDNYEKYCPKDALERFREKPFQLKIKEEKA